MRLARPFVFKTGALAVLTALALSAGGAHAQLFGGDDEARKAILDVRAKLEQAEAARKQREAELTEQISQLRRSLVDLNTQLEQLRGDQANQRGANEQLRNEVAVLQRQQRDLVQGVDDRLRKVEPQKVSVDGREFDASAEEQQQYNDAVTLLRQADFQSAAGAFQDFQKRYPRSGYAPSAQYWLGNAQYGKREYREAITTFRGFVGAHADHPRVPEALLAIANCQVELKDTRSARRTLEDLIKAHPQSGAATTGRELLAGLK